VGDMQIEHFHCLALDRTQDPMTTPNPNPVDSMSVLGMLRLAKLPALSYWCFAIVVVVGSSTDPVSITQVVLCSSYGGGFVRFGVDVIVSMAIFGAGFRVLQWG
jgi:hypothetical protein